ncbi:hypothetical protein ACQKIK_17060 [Pseudomonas sp. NPDC047961]
MTSHHAEGAFPLPHGRFSPSGKKRSLRSALFSFFAMKINGLSVFVGSARFLQKATAKRWAGFSLHRLQRVSANEYTD